MIPRDFKRPDRSPVRGGIWWIILALLLCLSATLSHAAPLVLDDRQAYPLAGHLEFLTDPTAGLSLTDVLAADSTNRFTPLPGSLNRGFTREVSWLRFSFKRSVTAPEQFFLWLSPPYLDRVTVYLQTGDDPKQAGSYTVYRLGDHVPAVEKPLQHPGMVVPLQGKADTTHQVIIRVQSYSSNNLQGEILPAPAFVSATAAYTLFQGGYLAIALALGIVNLILALQLKDRVYGAYGSYLLTLFLGNLAISGLIKLLVPGASPQFSDLLVGVGTGLGFSSMGMFLIYLFDTRSNHPWIHRYLQLLVLTGILTFLSSGSIWYSYCSRFLTVNGILLTVLMLVLAIQLKRRQVPVATLFLIAFLPSIIGAPITFARLVGLLPSVWLTEHALQIGSTLHMVLMTLALSRRVLAAEQAALHAARESEGWAVALAEEMTAELKDNQQTLQQALNHERQAHDEQGRFLDMVSHEYRTPLAVISANLDILELAGLAEEQKGTSLKKMRLSVQRMRELFDNYLRNTGLQRKLHLKPSTIDMRAFVQQVHEEARDIFGVERFNFIANTGTQPLEVSADPQLFKTVLLNLLDNAVKYSPPGFPVIIELGQQNNRMNLTIENRCASALFTPPEELFEKYCRGSNQQDTSGAGLGLYLARRIIEEHGGAISIVHAGPELFRIALWLPLSRG